MPHFTVKFKYFFFLQNSSSLLYDNRTLQTHAVQSFDFAKLNTFKNKRRNNGIHIKLRSQ